MAAALESKLLQPVLESAIAGTLGASSAASTNIFQTAQNLFYNPQIQEDLGVIPEQLNQNEMNQEDSDEEHPLLQQAEEELKQQETDYHNPILIHDDGINRTIEFIPQNSHPEQPLQINPSQLRPMLEDGGYQIFGNLELAKIYKRHNPNSNPITIDQYNTILNQRDFTPGQFGDAEQEYEEAKERAEQEQEEQEEEHKHYHIDFITPQNLLNGIKVAHKTKKIIDKIKNKSNKSPEEESLSTQYDNYKNQTEQEFPGKRYYIFITIENGRYVFHRIIQPAVN